MLSFLPADAKLPVSLQDGAHVFSLASLDRGGLYIGIGQNRDADEGRISVFLASALARVTQERPPFVVVDMRMDGGGDYTKTYPFASALPDALGPDGRIMCSLPRRHFSAAITTTSAFKLFGHGQTTIVGTHVGDKLTFWAEGGRYTLPNTSIVVYYTTGKHDYAHACTDTAVCFWLNYLYPGSRGDARAGHPGAVDVRRLSDGTRSSS